MVLIVSNVAVLQLFLLAEMVLMVMGSVYVHQTLLARIVLFVLRVTPWSLQQNVCCVIQVNILMVLGCASSVP